MKATLDQKRKWRKEYRIERYATLGFTPVWLDSVHPDVTTKWFYEFSCDKCGKTYHHGQGERIMDHYFKCKKSNPISHPSLVLESNLQEVK